MGTKLPTHLMGPGSVVQEVTGTLSSGVTLTTTIPTDNTIPQNTEGTEIVTVTITPKSATNILRVMVSVQLSANVLVNIAYAVFRDATAGAIAAGVHTNGGNTWVSRQPLSAEVVAGSTAPTTFKLRVGNNDGSATVGVNHNIAAALFGGAARTTITVTEVAA